MSSRLYDVHYIAAPALVCALFCQLQATPELMQCMALLIGLYKSCAAGCCWAVICAIGLQVDGVHHSRQPHRGLAYAALQAVSQPCWWLPYVTGGAAWHGCCVLAN
ncbi:hypothetical protein COO60DRAFT_1149841 [Scenedesmus sp. NREL 46B-D3]|nr:hypothetical protein COO60DRAFT_1149841 [Scenedesmus sp. NREL 46B-D3]